MATSSELASRMVKIISGDGHVFHIERKYAMASGTMSAMLEGSFAESRGEISFPDISTAVLERVIQYLYFKVKYSNSPVPCPEFSFNKENTLEIIMAANFLEC